MPSEAKEVSLFNYLDYRKFLQDWLAVAKRDYGFSYRAFSRRAGFRSPSLYKMVMDGQRDLVEGSLRKFLEGLDLKPEEREYFATLVLYNQATTEGQKERYLKQLQSLRETRSEKPASQADFKVMLRLAPDQNERIRAKIKEFSEEMNRLFGRKLESDQELVVTIALPDKR